MPILPEQPVSTKPAHASVPWYAWWGVFASIIIFIGSQFAASVGLSFYAAARHLSSQQLNNSTAVSFIFIVLVTVLVLLGTRLFLNLYRVGFRSIGLRRPRWSDPLYGLLALVPYFILFLLASSIIHYFVPSYNVNQSQDVGFNNVAGTAALLMTFISLVILPPLTEEIIFRGLLFVSLKKALPLIIAAVVTSALFAAGHLLEASSGDGLLYVAGVDTFVLSLVLIFVRQKTQGLWAGMTLHALKNGIAFLALFVIHVK